MNPIWLLRAKRWVQHPPSKRRVQLVFGVIALCLLIYGIDQILGLPDWMSATDTRRAIK